MVRQLGVMRIFFLVIRLHLEMKILILKIRKSEDDRIIKFFVIPTERKESLIKKIYLGAAFGKERNIKII